MDVGDSFRLVCRLLFGQEIGELKEFEDYLQEMELPYQMKKSALSGKELMVSLPFYPKGAKFISQDEMEKLKFPPLNINEIKDADSLFEAVQERVFYCGNKLFGMNYNVQMADNCTDCSDVYCGHTLYKVKNSAYSYCTREAEFVFGVTAFPFSSASMRCCEGVGIKRCFECFYSTSLADMYYAFNCIGCQNAIFAFNLRGKRNVIGNLELPEERFLELKKKLLGEIAEKLKKNKRIFSIADIALPFAGKEEDEISVADSPIQPKVEESFGKTTRLVLGKELKDAGRYGKWLLKNAIKVRKVRGAFGSPTYKVSGLPVIERIPANRLITLKESGEAAKKHVQLQAGETPGLEELKKRVSAIAYFTVEFVDGVNDNCVDTPTVFTGSNVYKTWDTTGSKNSGFSSGVINSECIFGGYLRLLNSQFCINCYDSTNIAGCFEVDCSYSSRYSYLCHNCENVTDCILCFNAKNLQYAVGNTEVGRERYMEIKKILLERVVGELEDDGKTEIGIFSIPKGRFGKIKGRK